MRLLAIYFNICTLLCLTTACYSCESPRYKTKAITVPAAGNSWVINDLSKSGDVISDKGITGWNDGTARIRTYFITEQTGEISISIRARVTSGTSGIEATFGNEKKSIQVNNVTFDTIPAGTFKIGKSGYQWIELQGISKQGSSFAEITDFIISGAATEGKVFFVKDDFYFGRRGPSVHLRYEIPSTASDIVWLYNEIMVLFHIIIP